MWNAHDKVATAQIVFYVPIIPLAAFVVHRNASKRPRMAWIPLLPFSLIRFVGGIVTILLNNKPGSVGLIIVTLILLGIGVIPLIVSNLGFIRIILTSCFPDQRLAHRAIIGTRLLFTVAAGLLVAGGCLAGNYKSSSSSATGSKLVKVGYLVFAGILGILIVFHVYLWARRARLSSNSMIILKATSLTIPFLIVRTAYALLSVFATSLNSKWDTIFGSAVAFALMALLMEYIVVCVYLYIGFAISSNRHAKVGQDAPNNIGRNQEFGQVEIDNSPAK